MTCIHQYSTQSSFTALKILCALPIHLSPHLTPALATTDIFTVTIVLPFPECHIVGIIQYVAFSDWLLSLSNMYVKLSMSLHGLTVNFFLTE